jgi:hypothetical protein
MSVVGYNEPNGDWHNYRSNPSPQGATTDFLATLGCGVYGRHVQHGGRGMGGVNVAGSRWSSLLSSIRTIQLELKRREPRRAIGLAGNPSAPESAILVAELRLGRRLPPSYREFLAFSDGWTNFFNGASLLGTGEIGRRATLEATHERLLARGRLLPFGADRSGASLFAFDTSVRLADGELGVVTWVGGLGIDCRCFTSFLATVLQLCRAELSTVKAADPVPVEPTSTPRGRLNLG